MFALKVSLLLVCGISFGDKVEFNGPGIHQVTEPLEHGGCPTWDSKRALLFFVDVHQGAIYAYNYATTENHSISLPGDVGPVLVSKNNPNLLIVGLNRSIAALNWDGAHSNSTDLDYKVLATVVGKAPNTIFSDGKADSKGRLWIGTSGQGAPNGGVFYKVVKENVSLPIPILSSVDISSGLAWNKANDRFYYIDSGSYQIVEYHFDSDKGEINNARVVFDLKEKDLNFYPNGMTIDTEDKLWVALHGGGAVLRIDPTTGEILRKIALPAELVTSVIWGGPNLDILFVTTSKYHLSQETKDKQPAAGAIFALTDLGTKGLPLFDVDLIE